MSGSGGGGDGLERTYWAYGSRLASTLPLPELSVAGPGPVRWTFRVVDHLPEAADRHVLGQEPIYGSVSATLARHAAGYRIDVDDTGSFDLVNDDRDIAWQPTTDPWWDFGRSHLLGRVLPTALQLSGDLTLHGSAVEMADGVVGFLAPKHFGKSTLALALLAAGARFVTDDALVVRPTPPVVAFPGIPSLRVRGEKAAEVARAPWAQAGEGATAGEPLAPDPPAPEPSAAVPGRDGKLALPPLPEHRVMADPTRLAALYLLHPQDPSAFGSTAERRRVPGVVAAMRLVGQTKIGTMLGSGFAEPLMDAAVGIASAIPIHELALARDLDRLPDVVDRLVDWHGLPDGSAANT